MMWSDWGQSGVSRSWTRSSNGFEVGQTDPNRLLPFARFVIHRHFTLDEPLQQIRPAARTVTLAVSLEMRMERFLLHPDGPFTFDEWRFRLLVDHRDLFISGLFFIK